MQAQGHVTKGYHFSHQWKIIFPHVGIFFPTRGKMEVHLSFHYERNMNYRELFSFRSGFDSIRGSIIHFSFVRVVVRGFALDVSKWLYILKMWGKVMGGRKNFVSLRWI